VRAYVDELAGRSASAVSLIKRLLYGMDGLSFEEAIARGAEVNVLARLTPDTRGGTARFLDRRK
jgi:enoyl-CoA hydratase/carnithine racemase